MGSYDLLPPLPVTSVQQVLLAEGFLLWHP
jgi:hypothetical protein